jgi:hypothetical protein
MYLNAEMLQSPSIVLRYQNMMAERASAADVANKTLQSISSTGKFPSLDQSSSSRNSPQVRPPEPILTTAKVIEEQRQKRLQQLAQQQSLQIQPSVFKTPQRPANCGLFISRIYRSTQNKLLAYPFN